MKLYHGTNAQFETIALSKSKDKRDFGKGFYTTTIFEQAEKWLEFVKKSRTEDGTPHDYDIIKGPVANDNTMRTIALYISGIYSTEQAIDRIKFFKVNNQISFHTEKALNCLTWNLDREVYYASLQL